MTPYLVFGLFAIVMTGYVYLLMRYIARVRAVCTCGAAHGKFLAIVDKPLAAVQRLDEKPTLGRRWTPADFGNLLPNITDKET